MTRYANTSTAYLAFMKIWDYRSGEMKDKKRKVNAGGESCLEKIRDLNYNILFLKILTEKTSFTGVSKISFIFLD